MVHSIEEVANCLQELEGAYRKSDADVKRVAENCWDQLHDPRAMLIIQRRIDTAKSDGELMECMRMQRFLQNAKEKSMIPFALAEEKRLYEALKQASIELWDANPSTMPEILKKHEAVFRTDHPFGLYFTRFWNKRHSKSEEAEGLPVSEREALNEMRSNANQCLKNFLENGIDFAMTYFTRDFQAWEKKYDL